jgi:hypothetical protein
MLLTSLAKSTRDVDVASPCCSRPYVSGYHAPYAGPPHGHSIRRLMVVHASYGRRCAAPRKARWRKHSYARHHLHAAYGGAGIPSLAGSAVPSLAGSAVAIWRHTIGTSCMAALVVYGGSGCTAAVAVWLQWLYGGTNRVWQHWRTTPALAVWRHHLLVVYGGSGAPSYGRRCRAGGSTRSRARATPPLSGP